MVAGYTISTAVLLVTGGRLGDRFGRRRVFSLGMAILVATVPLAAAFVAHQRRKADRGGVPLLNPRVFASWPLRAGLLTQAVFWCQQAASYLVLGLYLQQGHGLSPLSAGGVFTFLAAGYLRGSGADHAFRRAVIAAGA